MDGNATDLIFGQQDGLASAKLLVLLCLHAAAELDVSQIRAMTEELLTAHRDWLPGWTQ